jgi:hypothetical protein
MATDAVVGSGFTLSVSVGTSPPVITEIGQLKTASPGSTKVKFETITNTSSPRVGGTGVIYDEIIPTTASAGSVSFSGVFGPDDASHDLLTTLQDAGELSAWTIALPNSRGHWNFNGFVGGVSYKIEFDKAVEFSGTIDLTGPRTWTAGS